jgi:hypothetical protein
VPPKQTTALRRQRPPRPRAIDWDAIQQSVISVLSGDIRRIDGKGWVVYTAGRDVVRIEIRPEN